jgi:hypothetical protein
VTFRLTPRRANKSPSDRGMPDNLLIVLRPSICNDATIDFRM